MLSSRFLRRFFTTVSGSLLPISAAAITAAASAIGPLPIGSVP